MYIPITEVTIPHTDYDNIPKYKTMPRVAYDDILRYSPKEYRETIRQAYDSEFFELLVIYNGT